MLRVSSRYKSSRQTQSWPQSLRASTFVRSSNRRPEFLAPNSYREFWQQSGMIAVRDARGEKVIVEKMESGSM
jgi:hypothetical protein